MSQIEKKSLHTYVCFNKCSFWTRLEAVCNFEDRDHKTPFIINLGQLCQCRTDYLVSNMLSHNELKHGKKSILAGQCTVCFKG